MEPISLVIATFNEAATIGSLIREIPMAYRRDIIIADGGSADAMQAVARAAGARIIDAGHGHACALATRQRLPPVP
jgi:glycosyltransferase involved in cell wall biosynthesis